MLQINLLIKDIWKYLCAQETWKWIFELAVSRKTGLCWFGVILDKFYLSSTINTQKNEIDYEIARFRLW